MKFPMLLSSEVEIAILCSEPTQLSRSQKSEVRSHIKSGSIGINITHS
jgi:hypothetical protein